MIRTSAQPDWRDHYYFRSDILQTVLWALFAFIASGAMAADDAHFEPLALQGDTFIHDPSTVIKDGDHYYVFGTGQGIRFKSSPDLIHWKALTPIFSEPPPWTETAVPEFRGHFWAPDIIRVDGKFLLYYAVSTWGKQVSAIGVATSPTLDPSSPNYQWTDRGMVIASTNGGDYNTIDPSVMLDDDGKLWLAFGSYWDGIYLTELDPQTGLRARDHAVYPLAWNNSIEASCLTRHENYYYLFVNWGTCCQGTNSTYEVRMGRATRVTGPYFDRNGRDLEAGGGSKFLVSTGRFIGPGHIGILKDGDRVWFSYHYYDAATSGRARLAVGKLGWTKDGWPVPVPAP
ncbi:MAG TPA: arabinan endo-1,5-alpha-L-arabinosidase [Alphaproteobacteria bacterium]|nr:arabinan endo-1,5-alpha-L-arabinosidase [Alphaproteobacteria bacterium]